MTRGHLVACQNCKSEGYDERQPCKLMSHRLTWDATDSTR